MAGAPQPIMPAVTDASATALTVRSAGATPTLVPSISPELELQELLLPRAPLPLAGDALRSGSTAEVVISASARKAGLRAPAADAALKLLAEMLQPTARTMGNASLPASTLQRARGDDLTLHTNTPPPPFRGALPSAQPVAAPSITSNAPLATSAHHLLDDTDAAIARQTLLQAASLPDRAETSGVRSDPVTPRWNFEIPFATAQGTAMAQFEISRDGGGNEVEAATRVWRARFSLDVEPAGPVHAVVSLSGERTSVRIWAERPATAAQLRAGAAQLSQALGKAELQPGDIVIREGAPPAQPAARAGHFLDRAL
jgi:Flagellar hook-length control protein FliK